jgi:hypothetical protein
MVTGWMRRYLLPLLWWSALVVALLAPRTASADPRTSYLVDQLKTNEDYRVRTQAALALGASADDAAVQPLCDALGIDSNVSVRVAAAAALGKLAKPAGLPCLKTAEAKESAPSVKAQIQKSISTLAGGGGSAGGAPPPPGPDAKFYVAIQVTNKTTRPTPEIEGIVRSAMQAKLLGKKGYAVAPKSETTAQGGTIVKGKNLKGYFLIATVEPPVYERGTLTQVVRVSMWTYPGKALQGEFSPKLTQDGTPKTDIPSENTLMKMAAENAIETFAKVAASM